MQKIYNLRSYFNEIVVLVLMSTITLYLAQYLKEQLEVCRQHFLCRIRTKGYSYSAAHLTSSRGTPVAEHWARPRNLPSIYAKSVLLNYLVVFFLTTWRHFFCSRSEQFLEFSFSFCGLSSSNQISLLVCTLLFLLLYPLLQDPMFEYLHWPSSSFSIETMIF